MAIVSQVEFWILMLLSANFAAYWCKNINLQVSTSTFNYPRLSFQRGKFLSSKWRGLFNHCSNSKLFQVSDGETDEEDAVPPIIYEDKDTDDEESEVDAMETDEESQELGDVTDASEHSDGSDIMTDWFTCALL